MDIKDSALVERFIQRKTTKKNTKKAYICGLKKYFEILEIDNIDNYFEMNRNYTDDVWRVAMALHDRNLAPKTQRVHITAIKGFLERNDVEIKRREWGGYSYS